MTRDEALRSLQAIQNKGLRILHLLDEKPRTAAAEAEIRMLAEQMKIELQSEYERMSPERVQRRMSMFEISVYSPTIEETWKKTGISPNDGSLPTRPPHWCCGCSLLDGREWAVSDVVARVKIAQPAVLSLHDYDHLGPASATQLLDEPTNPEKPGDQQRQTNRLQQP